MSKTNPYSARIRHMARVHSGPALNPDDASALATARTVLDDERRRRRNKAERARKSKQRWKERVRA